MYVASICLVGGFKRLQFGTTAHLSFFAIYDFVFAPFTKIMGILVCSDF